MLKLSHQPVLLTETLDALNLQTDGIYIDCTYGRGGHTQAILSQLGPTGQILALDQDPEAVQFAQFIKDKRFNIVHNTFTQLQTNIEKRGWLGQVNGILLDLGVSSPQLDNPTRGFSFMQDGPLDMRMNPDIGESVAQWLDTATATEIAKVLKDYGEERYANRIARAIKAESVTTTGQLANIVTKACPPNKEHKHPATRSFQALRIFINRELEQLQQVLIQTLNVLAPNGRLVVICFHSLEDRIVKRFMRDNARGDKFPINLPVTVEQLNPKLRIINKPIRAKQTEINSNPRARSAILRVSELTDFQKNKKSEEKNTIGS
ncbi:16S rRNA (cytosine(1402)-N(4))-methyltransferase RsmH [Thiotrichales bacterium HSG1]|nr:16S rRNA (cytosine(1402)-N(4))-methyltransferase RsmH [Thiotrichales bacterium HSG1]